MGGYDMRPVLRVCCSIFRKTRSLPVATPLECVFIHGHRFAGGAIPTEAAYLFVAERNQTRCFTQLLQALGDQIPQAEQIAIDPYDRGLLLELWERAPARVDGRLLDELATVNNGRLGNNPRLRAWLREEWSAWARQNARRVARDVENANR